MEGSAAWGPGTVGSTAVGLCSTSARAGRWDSSTASSNWLTGLLCALLLQQAAAE